ILYEVLTGRPPFTGVGIRETLRQVQEEQPAPPRTVCPAAPPALEAVCLRALAKKHADRYPSARALAREVQRWLADEPVGAHREPLPARVVRWARRHKSAASGLAALLVTAVVALSVSSALLAREQARTRAAEGRARTDFRKARDAITRSYREVSEDQLLNEPG